jgi:hypothetical protein
MAMRQTATIGLRSAAIVVVPDIAADGTRRRAVLLRAVGAARALAYVNGGH